MAQDIPESRPAHFPECPTCYMADEAESNVRAASDRGALIGLYVRCEPRQGSEVADMRVTVVYQAGERNEEQATQFPATFCPGLRFRPSSAG